eukprot:9032589-Pyramimonas_sp.AAC.1
MWCNLCGDIFVVQPLLWALCGSTNAVPSMWRTMWCNTCGAPDVECGCILRGSADVCKVRDAIYALQPCRCNRRGPDDGRRRDGDDVATGRRRRTRIRKSACPGDGRRRGGDGWAARPPPRPTRKTP